ncbi:thioredoxin-disulfide reductase [Candidatus Woesebacteria bacterium RIFCSPHIGHO2_01_FULL_44_21]|uniref:Thioredoxin reductase n=1 Tax=Candidatus Woesebacteria bacterium RIFCSPHIGHO2_01_FULL_44_21 TaxID=1802503 RepID=A0A1F7Z1A1_9BACT|nr:MAG: thioredoxin-disulfide reductase [Candidatus Woesebacteria bacterium RIFCSPHIGHO2_01_FULL_44_21]OGM69125.1 MAG: thioredoxin-disulfide reductase [Candidatus Woesebacteria bacterium RIFCSPLOWO2_01_FULL_44_24b]
MENTKFFEKPQEGQPWDVAIIGSGPSAFSAAVYSTRGAASTLILGGANWGGQLMLTTDVDNYPGFPEGIQGPELVAKMRAQAERFDAEFKAEDVVSVDFSSNPFKLKTDAGEYSANAVIIGTGAGTHWLGVPGEEKLRGRGVSSCAPCDAPFFKEKRVVVVGGGDSAMEEALVLTKYATSVTIIHRRDAFRASQAMQQKVLANKKINVIWNSEVTEFVGGDKLEKVIVKDKDGKAAELPAEGAFVAIGHVPATEIFKGQVELDEKGYVKRYEKDGYKMATSKEGVFVAGDVHDFHYRQAVTAAGFGCMAGMEALKHLDKEPPNY